MKKSMRFDEILEAVERLPLEDQEALIDILERRRREQRRAALAQDIAEARNEFEAGKTASQTPNQLMKKIQP
jgi:hypothetical protein